MATTRQDDEIAMWPIWKWKSALTFSSFICIMFELFHNQQTVMQYICYKSNE